jgi:cytochrome c oxidase assembly protein Cox11
VPAELVKDGKLSVTFDNNRLEGVNWRFQPRLAEAWLLKNSTPMVKAEK